MASNTALNDRAPMRRKWAFNLRGPAQSDSGPVNIAADIVVTVVGGLNPYADMIANDTEKQEAALEVLLQAISDALNVPLEITDQRAYLRNNAYQAYVASIGESVDQDDEDIDNNNVED